MVVFEDKIKLSPISLLRNEGQFEMQFSVFILPFAVFDPFFLDYQTGNLAPYSESTFCKPHQWFGKRLVVLDMSLYLCNIKKSL